MACITQEAEILSASNHYFKSLQRVLVQGQPDQVRVPAALANLINAATSHQIVKRSGHVLGSQLDSVCLTACAVVGNPEHYL